MNKTEFAKKKYREKIKTEKKLIQFEQEKC